MDLIEKYIGEGVTKKFIINGILNSLSDKWQSGKEISIKSKLPMSQHGIEAHIAELVRKNKVKETMQKGKSVYKVNNETKKKEKKKTIPSHLKKILDKIDKKELEKRIKFGFTVTDKTPKGYGPNEAKTSSTPMECMECGHKFKKKLTKKTVEVKCPKCKGYDTDVA